MEHLPTLACALTDRFGPGVREEEAHGLPVRYSLLPAVPPLPTDLLSPRSHAMQSQEWLADLFALLEAAKERGQVDEYCVSQVRETCDDDFMVFISINRIINADVPWLSCLCCTDDAGAGLRAVCQGAGGRGGWSDAG
jgi:hypothetical protein